MRAGVILLAGAMSVGMLCAQGGGANQNTVFQQMFADRTTIGVSASARSIGQQFHRMDVYSGSCSQGGSIYLEGSPDGVTFTQLSPPITFLAGLGPTYGTVAVAGAFAYVRAHYAILFQNTSGSACDQITA
jgi:hypothetical protein